MNIASRNPGRSLRLLVLATLGALAPHAAQAVVPVTYPPPILSDVTINDAAGDTTDAHVDGDWAVYSSENRLRYYRFSTGVDAEIPPGASVRDTLSDVSGGRIVFCRNIPNVGFAIMVFDAMTGAAPVEIDPTPGSLRLGAAIGGDTDHGRPGRPAHRRGRRRQGDPPMPVKR